MNIRTFDLNLLRALHALLETGSVSAAARRLNRTQPATSAALARLRGALGDPLLLRQGNRMMLSPRAERLAPWLRRLMADLEQTLGEERFDPAVTARNFRIGATDDAIEILVAPAIERMRSVSPHAQFEIVGVSEDVTRDLATGKIDIAIAAEWWLRHTPSREPLLVDRYIGLSAAKKRFTLHSYAEADHVLVAPHGRKPGVVDAALRKKGMTRHVSVTVPDFASAARLAASRTTLIATMPSRIAAHYARHYPLHLFEPPLELPEIRICLSSNPRGASDPATSWLVAQFKSQPVAGQKPVSKRRPALSAITNPKSISGRSA